MGKRKDGENIDVDKVEQTVKYVPSLKTPEDLFKEAEELGKIQYQKDTAEFSDLLNKWLREKQYIIIYDVLWQAEGRMIVYPRLMKAQKQNG